MTGLEKAIYLAKHLETNLPDNLHVGLTGGTLYKDGERKDIDFVIYSHKCFDLIDTQRLAKTLELLGFQNIKNYGRVIKSQYNIKGEAIDIDIIVPESKTGEYVENAS